MVLVAQTDRAPGILPINEHLAIVERLEGNGIARAPGLVIGRIDHVIGAAIGAVLKEHVSPPLEAAMAVDGAQGVPLLQVEPVPVGET